MVTVPAIPHSPDQRSLQVGATRNSVTSAPDRPLADPVPLAGFFLGVFGEVVTQAFHPLAGLELGVLCLWYDDGLVDGKEVTGLG